MIFYIFILSLIQGDVFGQARPQEITKELSSWQKDGQFRSYCGDAILDLPGASLEKALMAGLIFDFPNPEQKGTVRHKALSGPDASKKVCLNVYGSSGNTRRILVIDLTAYPRLNGKLEFSAVDLSSFNSVVAVNLRLKGEKIPALCDETWINISDEGRSRSTQRRAGQAPVCEILLDAFHDDAERVHAFESFLSVLIQTAKLYRASNGQDLSSRIQEASDHLLELNAILGVR